MLEVKASNDSLTSLVTIQFILHNDSLKLILSALYKQKLTNIPMVQKEREAEREIQLYAAYKGHILDLKTQTG